MGYLHFIWNAWMLCIIFLFEFMVKISYWILNFLFCKYLWIPVNIKKICSYPHNGYLHRYRYGYEADIYPTVKVRGNFYLYPTRPIDIHVYGIRDYIKSSHWHPCLWYTRLYKGHVYGLKFPYKSYGWDHT